MALLRNVVASLLLFLTLIVPPLGLHGDEAAAVRAFRKPGQAVLPLGETTVIAEAEEFHPGKGAWQAKPFGTNYYAATFANAFLSRQAYLGAPEQCERSTASIDVQIPKAGKYLALVRYEAAYRFETRFTLQVEQQGKVKLDRLYGSRDNVKIWAFKQKLKKEVGWDWGAGENVVWEGHDATVELEAGPAKLTLIADKQPEDAARRNVDLVMLTTDEAQVKDRIEKENYLPLDGMLTQAGDVYLKVHNGKESGPLTLTVPHGTEHSPYWVHLRHWKPVVIKAEPGQVTDWVEVGSVLDTLSDGQWTLTAAGKGIGFDLEVGVRNAEGKIEAIRKLEKQTGNVALAYQGNTRYSRRIRTADEVLFDLVDYLKKQPAPAGTPLKRTLLYGYTFEPKPGNDKYNAALAEFLKLMGATALGKGANEALDGALPLVRGYIDVRGVPTPKLEEYCKQLQAKGEAEKIAVVSLGDEIGLGHPAANDHAGFRAWLKGKGVKPADLDAAAGDDYEKLTYSPKPDTAKTKPGLFYYSQLYAYRFGINQLKQRSDILKKHLPNAGIGANFSPHHGSMYLGPTHHWISLFREDGMTMPWGEDYIFQVPMGSQQVNSLMVDMFRAGIRGKPDRKIHYYVMPHTPNNTVASWRRQFYGDIAHGVKIFNLFEFRPVQAAYTENHCSDPAMFHEVRKSIHELGVCEDIVQEGQVRPGLAALWFSEAADVWNDNRAPFDAAKRALYLALRHQQIPLDVVIEGDDLKDYKLLYLTDQHVSRAASKAIADWVQAGGQLFATAGAGLFDELNQPNQILRELLGVEPADLSEDKEVIRFEKQDLPFARPLDSVVWSDGGNQEAMPVFGALNRFSVKGAKAIATFADKSPALATRSVGKGATTYCGFLPGLSYLKPGMPKRPWDRGSTDDSMTHFLPTKFDPAAQRLLAAPAGVDLPVSAAQPLVESTIITAKQGTLIPLINWNPTPLKAVTVTVRIPVPTAKVSLASGKTVQMAKDGNATTFTLDLDVADALILR
ncbi:MAG: beta-galactosidase trimerization domain-containing protein [Planctomycetia bacterium]|nr:beta-galactosidase trimerization domain-containing protein [Planctomycetia bacterium]